MSNLSLRCVVKENGDTVRMHELKAGDIFFMYEDNGSCTGKYQADENGELLLEGYGSVIGRKLPD